MAKTGVVKLEETGMGTDTGGKTVSVGGVRRPEWRTVE